jgi:hypothetical protein
MKSPFKTPPSLDLSKTQDQLSYVHEAHNGVALLHKEMDVNRAEQVLLRDRINTIKSFINELPASDPEYSQLLTQVQMDQIELDELKRREEAIAEKLKSSI